MDLIIAFYDDLKTLSDTNIKTIAQYYNLPTAPINDLRWMIAIHHSTQTAEMAAGELPFVIKFKDLQEAGIRKNDPLFEGVSESFLDDLDKLLQMIEQRKKMPVEQKREISKKITAEEKRLMGSDEGRILKALKDRFTAVKSAYSWLLDRYIDSDLTLAEISNITPLIDDVEWLNRHHQAKIDIKRYKSLAALKAYLNEAYGDLLVEHHQLTKGVGREGGEVLYDGKDVKIVKLLTQEGACYYGRGTKWCTAATVAENPFEQYAESGPLYIIQPKRPGKGGKEKYQLHFGEGQYMDDEDKPIELEWLYKTFPELEHLAEFDPAFYPVLLLNAVKNNNKPLVRKLVEKGVSPLIKIKTAAIVGQMEASPLMLAIIPDIAYILLESPGLDLSHSNVSEILQYWDKSSSQVRVLLDRPDIRVKDFDIIKAIQDDHYELAKMLIKHPSYIPELPLSERPSGYPIYTIPSDQLDILEAIMNKADSVNKMNAYISLIINLRPEVIKYLLEQDYKITDETFIKLSGILDKRGLKASVKMLLKLVKNLCEFKFQDNYLLLLKDVENRWYPEILKTLSTCSTEYNEYLQLLDDIIFEDATDVERVQEPTLLQGTAAALVDIYS